MWRTSVCNSRAHKMNLMSLNFENEEEEEVEWDVDALWRFIVYIF